MARYSPERKEAILKKMAPPHNMNVAELASQEGISTATLYNWRKAARVRGAVLPSNSAKPDQWSSEEKFRSVLETAPISEAELSEYCRKNGLYPEQIEAWKGACCASDNDLMFPETLLIIVIPSFVFVANFSYASLPSNMLLT